MGDIIERFGGKVNVRNAIHSHPEDTPEPSNYIENGTRKGDIPASDILYRKTPNDTRFFIFLPTTNSYIEYGPMSPKIDYTKTKLP